MKKRYSNTTIKKHFSDNKEVRTGTFLRYTTTLYGVVPEKNTDYFVITQAGDRLDNLAYQYYGSSRHWWFIAHVNNLNTMNVEPGIRLRIPINVNDATAF